MEWHVEEVLGVLSQGKLESGELLEGEGVARIVSNERARIEGMGGLRGWQCRRGVCQS